MAARGDEEKGLNYKSTTGANYQPPPGMPNSIVGPPAMSMAPGSLGDPYSLMNDGQEGYDFVFEPKLDIKYECPICLMCLREPIQTECGHRFCRSCITRSLRDAGRRCPIDNSTLTTQQFFPDVCVKREILDLRAHCPYRDCPEIVELRNMDTHQDDCRYGTLACPHNCGLAIRRKSADNHIRLLCPKRRVLCEHCAVPVPLDELMVHLDECTKAPSQCNHCNESMLREQIQVHVKTDCPAVVVDCRYRSAGCMQRMERNLMEEHLHVAMQLHMDLLANKLDQLNLSTTASAFNQPVSDASSKAADYADYQYGTTCPPYQRELPPNHMYGNRSSPDTIEIEKYGAKTLNQSMLESANYMSGAMSGGKMQAGLQRHSSSVSDAGDPRSASFTEPNVEVEMRQLKERVQILQRDTALQTQEILVLRANAERVQQDAKRMKDMTESLVTDSIGNLESRLCNGEFYWRLHGYSDMVREAQRGETSVRHSKGFYTQFYGYKLCLRVNINVSENSHNSHVSLFVHFLKGEFDDILDWPFNGKITLTIMDQNTDCSKRKPISETLLSKPDLAAFHRPRTHRNHKGFGYMEFAPITMLDNGTFIKDDLLLIRVVVEVKKS